MQVADRHARGLGDLLNLGLAPPVPPDVRDGAADDGIVGCRGGELGRFDDAIGRQHGFLHAGSRDHSRSARYLDRTLSRSHPISGALERDGFSSNRHLALLYCWSMIPRVEPEGMLFRKPVPFGIMLYGKTVRVGPRFASPRAAARAAASSSFSAG